VGDFLKLINKYIVSDKDRNQHGHHGAKVATNSNALGTGGGYMGAMERKRSCPAVSQICIVSFAPSMFIFFTCMGERIFIERMTSERKLKASREGSHARFGVWD